MSSFCWFRKNTHGSSLPSPSATHPSSFPLPSSLSTSFGASFTFVLTDRLLSLPFSLSDDEWLISEPEPDILETSSVTCHKVCKLISKDCDVSFWGPFFTINPIYFITLVFLEVFLNLQYSRNTVWYRTQIPQFYNMTYTSYS